MLGRRTRNLLVKLLRVLHAGAERLAARLEASDQLTETTAGEAGVAQDPAPVQLPNQGVGRPPAHWLEVVRHHAPQLLDPGYGQRDPAPRAPGARGAAPDFRRSSTLDSQSAAPATGQKTAAPASHDEHLPGPGCRVRQTSLSPELETQASKTNKRSLTHEGTRPLNRAPRGRRSSAGQTAVNTSRPARPLKETVVYPTPRPSPRQPSGESGQLLQRHLLRPAAGGEMPKPPPRSKVYDSSIGATETLPGCKRSEQQAECSVPVQGRHTQTQLTKRPDGANAVRQIVTPVREAMQEVAAKSSPRAARSSTPSPRDLPSSVPTLETTPVAQPPPRSTSETVSPPMQAEPEWPRLLDETDGYIQSTRTESDRWPSLPECAWDPGTRLTPREALRAASEEQRNTLRRRRRNLEQRGELWNV